MAIAADYYVTQSGGDADCSGSPCSVATFNTLTGTGYAGDTFYFSGTITSPVIIKISGTSAESPVTFDGYEAGECDALGTTCSSSAVMQGSYFAAQTQSYLVFRDFVFTNQSSVNCAWAGTEADNPSCSFITSCRGLTADDTCKTTGITVTNNRMFGGNSYGSIISLGFSTDFLIKNNYFEGDGYCTIGEVWHYGSRESFFQARPGGARGRIINNHVIDSFLFNYIVTSLDRQPNDTPDFPSSGSYTIDPEANPIGIEVAYNLYDGHCEEGISFDDPSGAGVPQQGWPGAEQDTVSSKDGNYIYLDNTGGEWTAVTDDRYSGLYLVNTVGNADRYGVTALIEDQYQNRFEVAPGDVSKFEVGDPVAVALIQDKVWIHHNRQILDQGSEWGWFQLLAEGYFFNGLFENNYTEEIPGDNTGELCLSSKFGTHINTLSVTQEYTSCPVAFNLLRYNRAEQLTYSNWNQYAQSGWDFVYNNAFTNNILWKTGDSTNYLGLGKSYAYYDSNIYEDDSSISVYVNANGGGLQTPDPTTGVPEAIYSQSHIGPNILATYVTGTTLNVVFTESVTGCSSGDCGFSVTDSGGAVTITYNSGSGINRIFTLGEELTSDAYLYYDGTGSIADSDSNEMYAWSIVGHDLNTEYIENPMTIINASPADGAEGQSDSLTITWDNPESGVLATKIYFDSTDGTTSVNDSPWTPVELYEPTLAEYTTYYWRVDIVHADGTETGIVRSFTTSGVPPPVAPASGFRISAKGGTIKFHPAGVSIKR